MNNFPPTRQDREPRPNRFSDRTPYSVVDALLIELQARTDDIGKIVYGQSPRNPSALKDYDMDKHADSALRLLQESPLAPVFVHRHLLHARYFYETKTRNNSLLYPIDFGRSHATIEGKIIGATTELLYYPHPDRMRRRGYRICAQIEAINVMGRQMSEGDKLKLLVPIGELYTEQLTPEQYEADALIPNDKKDS